MASRCVYRRRFSPPSWALGRWPGAPPRQRGRRAASIPLPRRALLAPPPKPACEFQKIGLGDTVPDTDEAARRKLDDELQCYRRAEMMMRARLRQLQASVAATVKAVERSEQAAW